MTINKFSYLRWIVIYSLTLAFLSLGYLFLTTQKGLDIAAQLTKQALSGTLTIVKLNGCILGPIKIKDLSYKDTDTTLTISSAQFDWHWSALLRGQLKLSALSIDKLILAIKEKQKNSNTSEKNVKKFQLPALLKHIRLNSVDIKQSVISYGANTLKISGSLHKQWNVIWQLTISKLENFFPDSHGQLFLKGKITGKYPSPDLYFSFPKTNLSYLDWKLKQVQGSFNLASLDNDKWFLDLQATQLKHKLFSVTPIHIILGGNLHPFSLQGTLFGFNFSRKEDTGITSKLDMPACEIKTKLTSSGLETKLITNANAANQLNAMIQLPNYKFGSTINSKQMIQGNIQLILKNLKPLSTFVPTLKNPQGVLYTLLNLSGPLFSPSIKLALSLKNGAAQIPTLNLNLKNINFLFHTDKNSLQGSGGLDSGKGTLTFQSTTQLIPTFPTSINLKGNNLAISQTKEYKIIASPTLQIKINTQHLETTGTISFPEAKIKIDENSFNGDVLSSDVVFVHKKKESIALPFTYKNNINLLLGDNIQFNYQGLHTKITGKLAVNQTSDHPILATGQLSLTGGKYTYYGQSLKLKPNSSLSFANSPIDNPNINITASKNVSVLPTTPKTTGTPDTPNSGLGSQNFISDALQTTRPIPATVGIHLQGYLANPKIILYADPSSAINSQLEILSYLITGQPSNQLSASSMQLLLGAAAQAGGKKAGFGSLINKAQNKIGIDQLTIGANPIFNPNTNKFEQNTSLIIGKNFSPRLNISYSLGLIDPISILQINYLLNKHFSVQSTNSNFSNGIDLLYKVEKH